jgi:hypothetical protein
MHIASWHGESSPLICNDNCDRDAREVSMEVGTVSIATVAPDLSFASTSTLLGLRRDRCSPLLVNQGWIVFPLDSLRDSTWFCFALQLRGIAVTPHIVDVVALHEPYWRGTLLLFSLNLWMHQLQDVKKSLVCSCVEHHWCMLFVQLNLYNVQRSLSLLFVTQISSKRNSVHRSKLQERLWHARWSSFECFIYLFFLTSFPVSFTGRHGVFPRSSQHMATNLSSWHVQSFFFF